MKRAAVFILIFLALASSVWAQEAPAPHRSPRTPVNKESLAEHWQAAPTSREVQGQVTILDSEKLHIADFDIRLFGIVPPQLSASFGPQARAALDELTTGQSTTCLIRDRDREGRFLATCRNANNLDLAMEMLRRGLAVVARGSVATTDLSAPYLAAEQAAETQKVGLWSVTVPTPASTPEAVKPQVISNAAPAPSVMEAPHPRIVDEKPVVPSAAKLEQKQAKTSDAFPITPSAASSSDDSVAVAPPGFMARYQLLVTGLIMLATALGMLGAIAIQRHIERRTEMRAIAAALRGELMAARAVCLGRLKAAGEKGDKDISWPRIRSTLYQAYVGRLGWLGAELARWVASIYGQASDYASYYNGSDDTRSNTMPKRQALQTLIHHIDEVLPRLAIIEHSGNSASAELGLTKAATISTSMGQSAATGNNLSLSTIAVPISKLWTKVQDLVYRQWVTKPPAVAHEAIAEYTALIEEEMKRFAFDEGEEESTNPNITRLHETGT